MDDWDVWFQLPFDCLMRVCKFLPVRHIVELAQYDARVTEYHRSNKFKHDTATKLQRWFRSSTARSRAINISSLHDALVLHCTMNPKVVPKYHTAMPRRRFVVARKDFKSRSVRLRHNYDNLICRIASIPKVRLELMGNGFVHVEDIPISAVIPMWAMRICDVDLHVHGDDPLPSYICFTEVFLRDWWRCSSWDVPVPCSNIPVWAQRGTMRNVDVDDNKKNPNLIPMPIENR